MYYTEQLTVPKMPANENSYDNDWLVIRFKSGDLAYYKPSEYTDYYYDKKCFVVIKDQRWIGIYNIDSLSYVEARAKDE